MSSPSASWRSIRFRLFLICVGISFFVNPAAFAQKVAEFDYTDVKPTERLRPPSPPPPAQPGQLVGGVCGGILSNSPLVVSILSLDRHTYAFGDELTFALQIRAVYPTRVPVRLSLAEIEPDDPSMSYKWRPLGITMELHSPGHRTVRVGLLQLYGSKDVPGSEIELKAGEWIELRGKTRMEWSNYPPNTLQPGEEKSVIRAPLERDHQFSAIALAHRAGSFLYNAQTKQENRVCDYPGEQSLSGAHEQQVTVTRSFKR